MLSGEIEDEVVSGRQERIWTKSPSETIIYRNALLANF